MRIILIAMALIALVGSPSHCSAEEPKSVEEIAVNYIADWKSGRICEAIDRDWDCKVLIQRILGEDYDRLSANDQNYIIHLQSLMIKASQNMPGMTGLIAEANFSKGQITELVGGEYLYSFELTISPDAPTSHNAIHFLELDGRFVIIDVHHNGTGVIEGLKPIYKQVVKEKISPLAWMEDMVAGIMTQNSQLRQQKAAQ